MHPRRFSPRLPKMPYDATEYQEDARLWALAATYLRATGDIRAAEWAAEESATARRRLAPRPDHLQLVKSA